MSPHSRYTILRKIADGGTAEIFLAKQSGAQGFEKMVVLKRIFNTFYSDPQFRHMLVDEAHIAMSLYHSNIVQVLDLGEADGRHFLALELVDGWTLDEVLKRAKAAGVPFPPALALYVTAEVCRALAYAHAKAREGVPLGIVHRDISPHNVLLSEHGEVKLTDFGIAKAQNKQEQSLGNMIKGKIAFMSPEQASGQPLDARSDLFSLGTMLHVMIARRPPFDAPTDFETLMQVRSGEFVAPEQARPGLNPEIYRVMRKAMGKTPAERYQNANEMLVDVEQVMRIAFRAVGQTELVRWLADLGAKDGVPPLTRQPPPPVSDTVVMQQPPHMATSSGSESGVELDLDGPDAVLVTSADHEAPPPPIPIDSRAHVTSLRPVPFWTRPGFRKAGARAGALILLMLLALVGVRVVKTRERLKAHDPDPGLRGAGASVASAPRAAPVPAAPTPAAAPAPPAPAAPPAPVAAQEKPPVMSTKAPAPPDDAPTDDADSNDGDGDGDNKGSPRKPILVLVNSEPESSLVSTGHHSFGATPLSIKLRPGNSYELTFAKPGYLPSTKVYRIARSTRSIRVTLKRAPIPRAPPTAEEKPPADSKKSWWKLHFSR